MLLARVNKKRILIESFHQAHLPKISILVRTSGDKNRRIIYQTFKK